MASEIAIPLTFLSGLRIEIPATRIHTTKTRTTSVRGKCHTTLADVKKYLMSAFCSSMPKTHPDAAPTTQYAADSAAIILPSCLPDMPTARMTPRYLVLDETLVCIVLMMFSMLMNAMTATKPYTKTAMVKKV